MKLTAITPVLNEEFFLPLWLETILPVADEVIVSDGGSTDATLDILNKYQKANKEKLVILHHEQGRPYSPEWNENVARNALLKKATGDWILALDVDELVYDDFKDHVAAMTQHPRSIVVFEMVAFWQDLHTRRVNSPYDLRWKVNIIRMWPGQLGVYYNPEPHHCYPLLGSQPVWKALTTVPSMGPVFHLHYGMGPRIKVGDNRAADVGLTEHSLDVPEEVDWKYLVENPRPYTLITEQYVGPYPHILHEKGLV